MTSEMELNETVDVKGNEVVLNRLRFNPMELILFTEDLKWEGPYNDFSNAYIETDDGVRLRLSRRTYPFSGFSLKTVDPDEIASLEKTEKLKIGFCVPDPEKAQAGYYYADLDYYICDPAWSTIIDLE